MIRQPFRWAVGILRAKEAQIGDWVDMSPPQRPPLIPQFPAADLDQALGVERHRVSHVIDIRMAPQSPMPPLTVYQAGLGGIPRPSGTTGQFSRDVFVRLTAPRVLPRLPK